MDSKLLDFWKQRSLGARIAMGVGAGLVVLMAIAAVVWVLRVDYQPLFTDLDAADASAIAAELDRLKVPYVVGDDGTTILVDKASVHATRLKVMGKGVDLKGTVGFEIFNNTDFGMTEFAQRINYQRALQGELARTIGAFEEIKNARVHLVLPESSLFRKSAVTPKASVTVTVRNGQRLEPEQIQGIQRLVAASVPEMEAGAVTVLDQQGVALSRRSDSNDGEMLGAGLEAKQDIEGYLTRKVLAVLDQAFGPGRAIVSVDVTLTHDHVKMTREEVLPTEGREGAVLRRKETSQRGAVSVAAADGVREQPKGPSTLASEIEYTHGRKVEQITSEPGGLNRISVGVMLPAPIDPHQTESLKQVIANAVGLNVARGDAIAISWVDTAKASSGGLRRADTLSKVTRAADRKSFNFLSQLSTRTWAAIAAAGLLACVLLVLLARRWRNSVGGTPSLSDGQREELLTRAKQWIGTGQQRTRA